MWHVVYTKQAVKDSKKVLAAGLQQRVKQLISLIEQDPFINPPPYEKLVGDLSGAYSRRINLQHRLVYQVYTAEKIVKVLRMWTHYE